MPIILVRHTRPSVAANTCYGLTDLDVDESFEPEANLVLSKLGSCDAIISSPLQRCTKLAQRIADHFEIDFTIDSRLVEMNFGRWEGHLWSEIAESELDEWAADFLHARPHGGESVAMLHARATAVRSDYARRPGTHVFVCHAGIIRSMLATGNQVEDFDFTADYGAVVALQHGNES